jgi:hypothetical protein
MGWPVCDPVRSTTTKPNTDHDLLSGHSGGQTRKAKDLVTVLEELTNVNLAPTFIRSDNGPEFIA